MRNCSNQRDSIAVSTISNFGTGTGFRSPEGGGWNCPESNTRERFSYPGEMVIDKPFNWSLMARLLTYVKPYSKKLLPLALAAMIVSTGARLFAPFMVSLAIDHALVDQDVPRLLLFAGVLITLYLLNWIGNMLRTRWMQVLGQSVIYDLREHLFRHIQRLSHRSLTNGRPAQSWFGSPMMSIPCRSC